MNIHFEIVTPERVVLKEEIQQVLVPTIEGEITILPKHMPLIGILKPGVLEIKTAEGGIETIAVSGGFVEVLSTKVVILADTAERAHEIDETRAEEARKRAEEAMKEKGEHVDFALFQAQIAKEMARIKAVHRHRHLQNKH
ncbi:ATP synthase F1 subunit epsilon [Candidatus Falkowbacteria bacterium CG10_big_fil_rev_8_21_14_0_10_37_6]|uniref:ATP synthase epsilon chain n=1 Tax=Candidatus Falkowbacteria bacterium CG10_big_fil_rev_8_21_14_0_10_37_6 TaxID=1974563 RepID=A0A2H0V7S5_9BACT|nr:MAG: ATP synthase F1 subunit epsilon [Candidatus Falkowbacteria bacterium CG10_big_fil_rev_8_21_14_0_10_37_6]